MGKSANIVSGNRSGGNGYAGGNTNLTSSSRIHESGYAGGNRSGGFANTGGNVNFANGNMNGGNGHATGNNKSGPIRYMGRNEGNASNAKYGSNGSNRKSNGDCDETRHVVLPKEMEASNNEENLNSENDLEEGNNPSTKFALEEIINFNRKQSTNAGKGIKKTTKKPDKLGAKKTGLQDGKKVRFAELQRIIHDLRRQKRFTQAFHLVCLSETLSPAKIMNDSLKLRKSNFLSIFDPVLKKHTVEQNLIAGGETEGWFWV
ncbi:hypothetical protein QYF36_001453 [Acer negundo]|nr:hypothetical protein QYF36_001453 [Acer negundo]